MRKLALLLVPALVVGCTGSGPDNVAGGSEAAVQEAPPPPVGIQLTSIQQEGRTIYETMCWTCHGPSGRGDGPAVQAGSIPPPPTFLTPEYANANPKSLERRFRAGLSGADPNHPHMQYVASILKPDRFFAALSYVPMLAYPPELPGSALGGQRLYNFRCQGCHGPEGKGDGPAAASLTVMSPANFQTDSLIAKKDWDGLFKRIKEGGRSVHGSSMPPWGVVLRDTDIWDVICYIATFQPGTLSAPPGH